MGYFWVRENRIHKVMFKEMGKKQNQKSLIMVQSYHYKWSAFTAYVSYLLYELTSTTYTYQMVGLDDLVFSSLGVSVILRY